MTIVTNCRFCGTPLTATVVDLGETPLANSFVTESEATNEKCYPLSVRVCSSCLLVQTTIAVSPRDVFSGGYVYFSSVTDAWVEHARRYTDTTMARFGLEPRSLVVEVASNDGYLLQHFLKRDVPVLGIEPAANVAAAAVRKGIPTEVLFFNAETARRMRQEGKRADLMVANNVLAHVPDLVDFLSGFALLLKDEGIATFEFPHVLNLVREIQFDTIYHEHVFYLSLTAVERVFAAAGLMVVDVEEVPTHGGSLRLYAARRESSQVAAYSVAELRAKERMAGLDRVEGYLGFAERVEAVKAGFLAFLKQARSAGKTVAGYGAAAKGNTFLNVCGATRNDLVCVFDRSVAKQGKLLPGSHIPVVAPERLADIRPDYLVILPWNIADEVMATNGILRSWGGAFIVAVPEVRVL